MLKADDKNHPGHPEHSQGWIGVDFDGTLAEYHGWSDELGKPIPAMVERVRKWLAEGRNVRIFTARCFLSETKPYEQAMLYDRHAPAVREWCAIHLEQVLPITNKKDMHMIELWDDRAVTVEANTGRQLSPSTRGL